MTNCDFPLFVTFDLAAGDGGERRLGVRNFISPLLGASAFSHSLGQYGRFDTSIPDADTWSRPKRVAGQTGDMSQMRSEREYLLEEIRLLRESIDAIEQPFAEAVTKQALIATLLRRLQVCEVRLASIDRSRADDV